MAKILLVEDDNNLREIYEARLQAEGYSIVSALDGEAALVIAKQEKPDLIISDVMMPRISGFEMLDILRNTEGFKEVKVIMLTALGLNNTLNTGDYATIYAPCLILLGDRDKMVTLDETVAVYKQLPNAQLCLLPNTQHPLEQADIGLLSFFIKRHLNTA